MGTDDEPRSRVVPFEPTAARHRQDRFRHKLEQLAADPRGDEYLEIIAVLMDALIVAQPSDMEAFEQLPRGDIDQMRTWAHTLLARRSSDPA